MSYSKKLTIINSDCNERGVLRPTALLRLMQEATTEHHRILGAGREECQARGILWMITHWYVRIHRMPRAGENIELETWPGKTRYVFFLRYFRLTDEAGELLVEGCAQWVLVGAESRSFLFPHSCGISIPQETKGCELKMPGRIFPPMLDHVGSFTVPREFIDGNGHMNNARYLDIAENYVNQEAMEVLRELRIEYHSELLCGETAEIFMAENAGYIFLEGYHGKLAFRMELGFV